MDEIQAVARYFRLGDVEAAGFVHRNQLSMVMRRLDGPIVGASQLDVRELRGESRMNV